MIFYIDGYKSSMTRVNYIPPIGYQNNRSWAIRNKAKGLNATLSAISSTVIGSIKVFVERDSLKYKLLNFGQKVLEALRNLEQYLIYKEDDDDVGFDKKNRPLAGKVGAFAAGYETKINPIAVPIAALLPEKISNSYEVISNWFNAIWWRFRLCFQKINFLELKELPKEIKKLFQADLIKRNDALCKIRDILIPYLGYWGSFATGLFVPIKAWHKLMGNENKWVNASADSGFLSQHEYYFVRFTLDELFKAQENNNKYSWYLFGVGLVTNIMNITLPIIDVLPLNNKVKNIWRELALGLTRIFFSSRRHINGNQWLQNHSESSDAKGVLNCNTINVIKL